MTQILIIKRLESGPKKLSQVSRSLFGIRTPTIALQEYQKDRKKSLLRRKRRVTRRGRTTISNPSHRISMIRAAPNAAAAIFMSTSSQQGQEVLFSSSDKRIAQNGAEVNMPEEITGFAV